jgi:SAM-dependent methyltransferase
MMSAATCTDAATLQVLTNQLLKGDRVARSQLQTRQVPVRLIHGNAALCSSDLLTLPLDDDHQLSSNLADEYNTLFLPQAYHAAPNNIRLDLLPRVVSALNLQPDDCLVDLGCATGRLALACALIAPHQLQQRFIGVDLSPSRVACAQASLNQLNSMHPDLHLSSRICFIQGDVSNTTPAGSIYFFGIKLPRISRDAFELMTKTISSVRAVHANAGFPFGAQCRVVCAGFSLPHTIPGVRFVQACTFPVSAHHNFSETSQDEPSLDWFESFYGDARGSRLLLMFEVQLDCPTESIELQL